MIEEMTAKVRCPHCRGAKKVMKLGGMMGECNTCCGRGSILGRVKPVFKTDVIADDESNLIRQVSDCVPCSADCREHNEPCESVELNIPPIKSERKTLYKRKS